MTDHSHGNDNAYLAEHMPHADDCRKIADVFSRLGDGTRLRILWILCHSEQCVAGIASLVQMSSPAIAHHLKLLKDSGLIVARREGREMRYRLGDTDECRIMHRAMDALFHISCPKVI